MSWDIERFAAFPPTVAIAPADIGLWITDRAVERLAFAVDDDALLAEVPLCGVWIGLESPLNVLGHEVHALHLQSLDGMAIKTHFVASRNKGIPERWISRIPPRAIYERLEAEGVTYISAYTVPTPNSVFTTVLECKSWKPVQLDTSAPGVQRMIRTAKANRGRMAPEPDGGVELLVGLVRAALTVTENSGDHGVTAETVRVPVKHADADYAELTILDAS